MLARAALATLCWLTPMLLRADAVPGGLYAYGPVTKRATTLTNHRLP